MNECECKLKQKTGVFVLLFQMRYLIWVSRKTGAEKGTARESGQISSCSSTFAQERLVQVAKLLQKARIWPNRTVISVK